MQPISKKEVGRRIKKLRLENNLTQAQLAERLYYATERQLQRIENGETLCSTDKLAEVAQILGTTTDYLLLGERYISFDEFQLGLVKKGVQDNEIFLPIFDGLQLKINFVLIEV